jgi:hypothetical protein
MRNNDTTLFEQAVVELEKKDYAAAVLVLYTWFFSKNESVAGRLALAEKIAILERRDIDLKLVEVYSKKRKYLKTDLMIYFADRREPAILASRISPELQTHLTKDVGVGIRDTVVKEDEDEDAAA